MPAPTFAALSLTELIAIRARDQPTDVAFYTGIDEPGSPLRSLTYSQVQRGVDRLCTYYAALNLVPPSAAEGSRPQRSIAVFTSTAIDESLLEIALAKLTLAPLLLSVNNSVPAVAHLCKLTKATHLIYGSKFPAEAKEAQRILAEEGYPLEIIAERRFPLWGPGGVDEANIKPYPAVLTPQEEYKRTAVILHSSGSTGFPKPVFITHKGLIANLHGYVPRVPGFSALPVYHGFGHYSVFRCCYNAVPFTLIPPHLPLTSANICRIIKASPARCRQCFAVPYVIKLLGETEEGTRALADFDIVVFSGAALPDDLGERLTAAGVNLVSIYGTTETGSLLHSKRDYANDKSWNWVRAEGLILDYLKMEERGSNTYETVVKEGWPAKIQTNRPDGSYATKDLFVRHKEHHNWYKYVGRLDDTLVQVLGEKTNPVPIELAIRGNSPYVEEAIVFGEGRPQVGCLILPSEFGKELSKDRVAFLEKIWPVIEDANAQAPTHSRLLPEMVHILDHGTQIPVATKMTILRPACYAKFKDIIDSVYDRFENGTGSTKLDLSKAELQEFIYKAIVQTFGASKATKLTKSTDLFAFGVDSLQATRIRNICQKELELNGHTLVQNVVYENPSIEKLSDYIMAVRAGGDAAKSDEQQQATMLIMVDKWSSKFDVKTMPASNGVETEAGPQAVVLTGATGSLGAHILQQLVSLPNVTKVVCLSRANSHAESLERLRHSLDLRRLSLMQEQWIKVESFAANINEDKLGLTEDEYASILTQATTVVHNAWPVNFNLSVDSFDEHVGGAVNLINLCLRSTKSPLPSFYFSSSIATRTGSLDLVCTEDFSASPSTANGTGYGRSKWIVEKVCERAGKQTPVHVGVLRIGQLAGDTKSGVWNETEAWPLMFKAVKTTGALPRISERPSWLPVDMAASGIVEIVTQPQSPKAAVYHILNHKLTTWDTVLAGLKQAGVRFDVVDSAEWLNRLAKSDSDVQTNPAVKLLAYYRERFGKLSDRPPIQFSIDGTSQVSPSIAACKPVSEELIGRWVQHWREVGFLEV
ncbi:putative three-domain protein [Sparassis crispa]|uniref:Putative three-domain protein n=1 Tax=Sparassis crispa TaxID=139825 RepID=A0A401G4W9_9APHY|nr:putative three-domain protein [Sparassis crispa]GBE77228.1 putative three-domain protein [Sparassis crispa]